MKNFKVRWKIRSPLITELESDTIFGHFCWAWRYIEGEESLIEFLSEVSKGRFVLSSAFPCGFLPAPFLPEKQIALDRVYEVHKNNKNSKTLKIRNEKEFYRCKKEFKKNAYIPLKIWEQLCSSYSTAGFLDSYIVNYEKFSEQNKIETAIGFRNKIDRITGKTGEGNLFAERVTFYENNKEFTSYIKTDLCDEDKLKKIFNYISASGFGRKKSIGKGNFDISVEQFDFKEVEKFNAHLVLSNMIPAEDDSTVAYWKGNVKFGKLGGTYANTETPFKFPFYYFLPGSVFIGEKPPKGRMLNVHPEKTEIVQNLFCYSIPFYWDGKND